MAATFDIPSDCLDDKQGPSEQKESLAKNCVFTCICNSPFSDSGEYIPLLLKCGHTFCEQCTNKLKQPKNTGFAIKCPSCHKLSAYGASGHPSKNFSLLHVITTAIRTERPRSDQLNCNGCDNIAEFGCDQCVMNFCADCWEPGHSMPKRRQHQKGPTLFPPVKCEKHSLNTALIVCMEQECPTTGTPICSECERTEHRGHHTELLTEIIRENRQKVQEAINAAHIKVEQSLQTFEQVREIDELLRKNHELTESTSTQLSFEEQARETHELASPRQLSSQEQAQDKIAKHVDRLRLYLQEREKALMQSLHQVVAEKGKRLDEQKQQLTSFLSEAYLSIYSATESVDSRNDVWFLSQYPVFLERLSALLGTPLKSKPVVTASLEVSFGRSASSYEAYDVHADENSVSEVVRCDESVSHSAKDVEVVQDEEEVALQLYQAAQSGDLIQLAAVLSRQGENSSAIDVPNRADNSRTPICVAAKQGRVGAIEMLVQAGSKAIDTPDLQGHTPMWLAASHGHAVAVEMLVRLGSKAINASSSTAFDTTPLHAAAYFGHVNVIATLVRLGSNAIDTPDNNGWTPMHAAAKNGQVEAIATLVRLGSTALDARNNNGRTPLYLAAKYGHADAVETLKSLLACKPSTHQAQFAKSILRPRSQSAK